MKKSKIMLILFGVLIASVVYRVLISSGEQVRTLKSDISIIPAPLSLHKNGEQFLITSKSAIEVLSESSKPNADFLSAFFNEAFKMPLPVKLSEKASKNSIVLEIDNSFENEEAYTLEVTQSNITIKAATERGIFYGIQSLIQLAYPQEVADNKVLIPGVKIADEPKFKWRGMHLDVSRHFYPKEFIMKMIDVMAMHKLNTFHWHLTDDQGWRIEIKKYPKLTEVAAWRNQTLIGHMAQHPYHFDGMRYGGYYTQEEIKEVIAFANSRHVNILPEIEMPGHAVAVLSAYPQFSCTGGPFEVRQIWGISDDVFCAGNEKTFEFLQDVLEEVAALFPYEYIHIGGDESPKDRWEKCKGCQKRIKDEGLHDEHELQSYFIKRIEAFLDSKGKKLIGWDEILEGGLPERATVMSWRGYEGGIEAIKQGHDVVMSPTSYCYLDFYQAKNNEPMAIDGYLPLEKVYSFDPIPAGITEEQRKHVLGGQANVWTEYMPNSQHVEYMVFPRLVAMAEVLWTSDEKKNWQDFKERLTPHYVRLDLKNINYRISPPEGFYEKNEIDADEAEVNLVTDIPGSQIRYTIDGSEPDENSPLFSGAFGLPLDQKKVLKAKVFLPNNKASNTRSGYFVKATYKEAREVPSRKQGLMVKQYNAPFSSAKNISGQQQRSFVSKDISLPKEGVPNEFFGMEFSGYIEVPADGIYKFLISSNDGSVLYIGDELIIDNDGFHYGSEKLGMASLKKGLHPIKISYFQAKYGKHLVLKVQAEGKDFQKIPAEWLWH